MQKINRTTGDRALDEDIRRLYKRGDDFDTLLASLKVNPASKATPTPVPLPPVLPPSPGSSVTPVEAAGTPGTLPSYSASDHAHEGVHSIAGTGQPQITGDATIHPGTGLTLAQVGNQITLNAVLGTITPTVITPASSPYTVAGGDFVIFANTTTGPITVQLVGSALNTGRFVVVVNTGTGFNAVTITSSPGSVIGANKLLNGVGFATIWYISDGTNWYAFTDTTTRPGFALPYQDASVPSGNTISNTSAEVAFASSYTIPANILAVGMSLRLKLYLIYNCIAGSQVVELKVKVGSQTLLDTGIINLGGPMTNGGMVLDADLFVTAIGSSGSIEAQGAAQLGVPLSGSSINIVNTSAYTVNTTINEAMTFTWQFGTANTGNNVTLRAARVEILQ